jgi:GNAT superfamily N-acetyltransferase
MVPEPEDFRQFLKCFVANGSPRTEAHLRWQYSAPPPNRMFAELAESSRDGTVKAIYAVFPAWMKLGSDRVLATQSLDTLTDKEYRGKGLFVCLAERLYSRLGQQGAALVYGFPNANSARGFFSKLGWISLGRAPFLIRPMRTGYVLSRLRLPKAIASIFDIPIFFPGRLAGRGSFIRVIETPTDEMSAVWESFAKGIRASVARDAEYLRWRLDRPGEKYTTTGFYDDGKLIGFLIFGITSSSGSVIGKLMDLVYEPSRPDAARALLADALSRLARLRAGAVWAWNLEHSPNARVLKRAGFIALPEKLHPLVLHFGVRPLIPGAEQIVAERKSWYISLLDSDTD